MKKKIMYGLMTLFLIAIAAGCAAAPTPMEAPAVQVTAVMEGEMAMEEKAESSSVEQPSEGSAPVADAVERLIIRNASLELVVDDTEEAVDNLNAMASEMGGYVVESNMYTYQEGMRAHLTLRVPAEKLDGALERVRALATEVRRESISGQDVTEEYVDLKSRLRYLEATEERLLEFMDEAEDTEAALEVYGRLQSIQADIEQVKGRMQYLEQSAAMATIDVDIIPNALAQPIEVGGWHPEGTLRGAFESLIKVLQFLVKALIVIVVFIIPVLLVLALPLVGLFFLVRKIRRRRRARKEEEKKNMIASNSSE
jgi:hypothetical protein